MVFTGLPGLTQTRNYCLLYESTKFPDHFYEFAPRNQTNKNGSYQCLGCQKSTTYNNYFEKRLGHIMVEDNCFLTDPDKYSHVCSPFPRLYEIGRQVYRGICKEVQGQNFSGKELLQLIKDRVYEQYPDEADGIMKAMSNKDSMKRNILKARENITKENVEVEIVQKAKELTKPPFEEEVQQSNLDKNENIVGSSNASSSTSNGAPKLKLPPFNAFHYNYLEQSTAISSFGNSYNPPQYQLPSLNTFHFSLPSQSTSTIPPLMHAGYPYIPGPTFQSSYAPFPLTAQRTYHRNNYIYPQYQPYPLIQPNYQVNAQQHNHLLYLQQQNLQKQHSRQTLSYFKASLRRRLP